MVLGIKTFFNCFGKFLILVQTNTFSKHFAKTLDTIEANYPTTTDIDRVPPNTPYILDGMVLVQQIDTKDLSTFGDISLTLLQRIIKSDIIYFVTDQYRDGSIKSFERDRRASTIQTIRMKVERRNQSCPRQWKKFLRDANNKTQLINFLLNDWKTFPEFRCLLAGRTIFFNVESKFYKLTCNGTEVNFHLYLIYTYLKAPPVSRAT